MSSVGQGVFEVRIRTAVEHRIFYVAKFEDAVYVLHSFEKKSRKTPKRDVELGRKRYAELLHVRREIRKDGPP